MTLSRILVADDEPQIQRFLKAALTAADYEVVPALTAAEAERLAATKAPDLLVLDLGLPDRDGKTVIQNVRAWSMLPIIILSARDREAEKIEALDLGADDYVEKPFGIGELLARMRTLLRRQTGTRSTEPFEADGIKVDLTRRVVTRDGATVHLTPKEYDLLQILVEHPGLVLTHRQLLTRVWGPAHIEDVQYLRVIIAQLRAKLEPDGARHTLILSEPGVGYRLSAEPPPER